jgi:hypothetical protein
MGTSASKARANSMNFQVREALLHTAETQTFRQSQSDIQLDIVHYSVPEPLATGFRECTASTECAITALLSLEDLSNTASIRNVSSLAILTSWIPYFKYGSTIATLQNPRLM